MAPQPEVTALLQRHRAGDPQALEVFFSVVYEHLRRIAHAQLNREMDGHTLCTTALVHEAYLKLADPAQIDWQDRQHLLALASRAMRQILRLHLESDFDSIGDDPAFRALIRPIPIRTL